MSVRVKIALVGVLLCLAIGTTAVAAASTLQAFQHLQQERTLSTSGDVRTIRPWMTIPYIAHLYHVPESYLYRSLHVNDNPPPRHVTLQMLSTRYKRPVDDIVHTVQTAVQTYRKQHHQKHNRYPGSVTPTPTKTQNGQRLSQKRLIEITLPLYPAVYSSTRADMRGVFQLYFFQEKYMRWTE